MKNKNNLLILCFGLLLLIDTLDAQPIIEWEKTYGGTVADIAFSVQQTIDGGYIVAGHSNSKDGDVGESKGEFDNWILKLDQFGNLEWEKNYGGSKADVVGSIKQTIDEGFIVAGTTESSDGDVGGNGGEEDYWLLKLDKSGNLEWEKTYGGINSEVLYEIQNTNDKCYIVAGNSRIIKNEIIVKEDPWILKLDQAGNLMWEKKFDQEGTSAVFSVQQTNDQGYIFAGRHQPIANNAGGYNGEEDFWIFKLDIDGNLEWEKMYGGTNSDAALSIQQTIDGGYIVAGESASNNEDVGGNNGSSDYWILKLKNSGEIEWENNYGGSLIERPTSLKQSLDGGYIIAGSTMSNDFDVEQNNGFINGWIIKLDKSGNLEWEENFGGPHIDLITSVDLTMDGGFIVVGSKGGEYYGVVVIDLWIIKFVPLAVNIEPTNLSSFSIYPNPSYGEIAIHKKDYNRPYDLNIYDQTGRSFYTKNGIQKSWKVSNLPKGQYFVRMISDKHNFIKKIITY